MPLLPDPLRTRLERLRPWWPHLRAAFVAFHLVAIVLSAIPAPAGGMDRRNWKDPTVQGEFRAWGAALGMNPETLEEGLYRFATVYMKARDAWLAPVDPYLDATGTKQPWRMFVAPHRHPARFRVEVENGSAPGQWELLFEERSSEARWRESFFEQERMRSILFRYAWTEYSSDARRLCGWLADRVFEEREDARTVRCRFAKARSPSAAEVRDGAEHRVAWVQSKTIRRKPAKKEPGPHAPFLRRSESR